MAIDTRPKRQSVAVLGLPFQAPGITPDATQPQAWRQTSGWSYYGILAAAPAASGTVHIIDILGISEFTTPATGTSDFLTPELGVSEFTTPTTGKADS